MTVLKWPIKRPVCYGAYEKCSECSSCILMKECLDEVLESALFPEKKNYPGESKFPNDQ